MLVLDSRVLTGVYLADISYQGQCREFRVDTGFQGGFMIGSRVEIQFSKLIAGSRADAGFKI